MTNVVKEPTPNNRKPTVEETRRWMPYLVAEINRVKPRFIVLMGQVAWKTPRLKGIEYVETYHPTAAMRFPKARQKFLADFGALKDKVAAISIGEVELEKCDFEVATATLEKVKAPLDSGLGVCPSNM